MLLTQRIAQAKAEKEANAPKPIQRIITVRLTKELHEKLKEIAWDEYISLNSLCVAALEQAAEELRPVEEGKEVVA